VDVTVNITTELNEIVIQMTNLESNPTAVSQLISGLSFDLTSLDSHTVGLSVDTADSGHLIDKWSWSATPANDNTDTIDNWTVSSSGGTTTNISLSALSGRPADLVIGKPGSGGSYTNANDSLTNCHACPLILYTVTFDLSLTGTTTSTNINTASTLIKFGTQTTGESVALMNAAPEPDSTFMTAAGGGGIIFWQYWRRRISRSKIAG
jgi:hypothetical protein